MKVVVIFMISMTFILDLSFSGITPKSKPPEEIIKTTLKEIQEREDNPATPNLIQNFMEKRNLACSDKSDEKVNLENIKEELIFNKKLNNRMLYLPSIRLKSNLAIVDQARLDKLNISRDTVLANIEKLNSEFNQTEKLRKEAQLCVFKRELKKSIGTSINEIKQKQLGDLLSLSGCFSVGQEPKANELSNNIFNSIFNFYYQKPNLNQDDCEVLKKTYEVWASFYDNTNNSNISDQNAIPFYNVNPHYSSYFYWMKERQKGRIPPGGLSLLHIDTHTDLGHVHSHSSHSLLKRIPMNHQTTILYILREKTTKEAIDYISSNQNLFLKEDKTNPNGFVDKEELQRLITWLEGANKEEVINQIELDIRNNVHDIAQPLTAGVASDVTDDLVMVLPPWSTRMNRSKIVDGKAQKQNLSLAQFNGKIELFYDANSDVLDLQNSPLSPLRAEQSLNTDRKGPIQKIKDVTISVADANAEKLDEAGDAEIDTSKELAPFSAHLKTKDFILDIDLDAFVSEGIRDSIHSPISYERTKSHNSEFGQHSGHDVNTETDPNTEVSTKELDLIKARVESFAQRLEQAKAEGYNPAMITISDSTILKRALEGQRNDSNSGGNFTPSCLVFLLNYMMRNKLKSIYNINFQ